MNLGELKKALTRFPPDMDDTEVLIQYVSESGDLDADCLAFVGYVTLTKSDATAAVLLGTWEAADEMQKNDPSKFPADYKNRPKKNTDKHQKSDTNEES